MKNTRYYDLAMLEDKRDSEKDPKRRARINRLIAQIHNQSKDGGLEMRRRKFIEKRHRKDVPNEDS